MISPDLVPESLSKSVPDPLPTSLDPTTPLHVSLASLGDVAEGDTVEFKVASIDPVKKEATLIPLKDAMPAASSDSSLNDVTSAPGGAAPAGGKDTNVLLGPMDKLKGYLMKKSQDVSKSEAP